MPAERTAEMTLPTSVGQALVLPDRSRLAAYRRVLRHVVGVLFVIALFAIVEYKLVILFDTARTWGQTSWKFYSLLTSLFLLSRFVIVMFYEDDHAAAYPAAAYPPVTMIIAAKNEEGSIYRTVQECMRSEYPGWFECIAVNDGSADETGREMKRARRAFGSIKGGVRVIEFPTNRGKREGMAVGTLAAKGQIFVFVDSDSFVKRDAVRILVEHFMADPKVGAVSGNTGVENESQNFLTKMQSARYGVSYEIFKSAESVFGAVSCCSGCFSAYRRSAMMPVINEWRHQTFMGTRSTFGDDRSLTNFVLKTWQVAYCSRAKATTVVPHTWRVLWKQQFRWKKSWIREGSVAARFIWRKHPIAAGSFYINLILPIFGPIIVAHNMLYAPLFRAELPIVFLTGIIGMSIVFGMFYYLRTFNNVWWYVAFFSVIYTMVLIWQMPWAILRLRDTSWGTR